MSNEDQKKIADLLLVCKRTQTSRSGIQHAFHNTSRFRIFFLFKRNYFQCMQECACRRACLGACACILPSDCSTLVRSFFDRSSVRLFAGSSFISINIWKEPFVALLFFNDGNEEFNHRDNASRSPFFFFLQVIIYLPKESFASNTKWLAIPKTFGSAH